MVQLCADSLCKHIDNIVTLHDIAYLSHSDSQGQVQWSRIDYDEFNRCHEYTVME